MIINFKTVRCDVYILLYVLYSIVSTVYPGTSLSQLLLLALSVMSAYYAIECVVRYKQLPLYIKRLIQLIILFTIYGIVYYLSPQTYIITEGNNYAIVPKINYLKNIYLSLLPIVFFYHYAYRGIITEQWLRKISVVLVALAIFLFIYKYRYFVFNDEYGRTEMTNNHGYTFVALFPLLFLWRKKPLVQLVMSVVILTFVIVSMKRGAILIGAVCSLYFLISVFRNANNWGRVGIVLALGLLVYIGTPILSDYITASERFQERIADTVAGDSSNRDVLYSLATNHMFYKTNLLQFFFGTGADSSIAVLTNYAHNDWFEIGINQGILGVLLYLLYYISFYKSWTHAPSQTLLKHILGMCFIICFLSTLFSMSYSNMDISSALCIGYSVAQLNRYKTLNTQLDHYSK